MLLTANKKEDSKYTYDANGNQIYVNTVQEKLDGSQDNKALEKTMLWDEENRLGAISINGYVSSYTYDAGGERVSKLSGGGQGIFVNSAFSGGKTSTSDFTLYTSPYLVAQSGGRYTKHIYVGSQRIVSKLGDFDSYGADPRRIEKAGDSFSGVKVDYASKYKSALNVVKANYESLKVPYYGLDNDDYVNGLGFCCKPATPTNATTATSASTLTNKSTNSKADNAELQQYYYHPDHLGSSSYITNLDGEVVQHVEYVPFGEVFLEEKNAVWNTPYLFNGKELDKETGMSYYGARYYEAKTSLWLSVDPLAEKYPNASPYNYCLNNPVNLVDPDGRDIRHFLINHLTGSQNLGVLQYAKTTKDFYNSMRGIMQTKTGQSYLSQFMRNGQKAYGYKATQNGKYSDVNFNIYQVDLKGKDSNKRGLFFMADADAQVSFEEKNGKLEFNVWIGNDSASDLVHEFFVHYAGIMDEIIAAYKKGGINAAILASGKYSEDDDHKAVRDYDKKHPGVKKYLEIKKELEIKDSKYKIEFERAHKKDNNEYKDLE